LLQVLLWESNKHLHNGWAIPGIGGTDMVIGGAGTTVALPGGGIPGIAIPIGGGTEIIGGAGYTAGVPTLIRTDPTTIGNSEEDSTYLFIFYEPKIMPTVSTNRTVH
jgi:hypothetical protein